MKMKNLAIGLVVCIALWLGGCTTTGDVMQRAPAAEFTSAQSAQHVSGCIAPRVLKDWGQSKVTPAGDGFTIAVSGSAWGNPVAIIDVQPASPGSHVSIRRGGMVSDRVFGSIVTAAQACR